MWGSVAFTPHRAHGVGTLRCAGDLGCGCDGQAVVRQTARAVMGYNPHKPGRPSHASHSFQVSGLRLMLGVDVLAGNESHANHTLPWLLRILDGLGHPNALNWCEGMREWPASRCSKRWRSVGRAICLSSKCHLQRCKPGNVRMGKFLSGALHRRPYGYRTGRRDSRR